ncbi:MAG: glycosyltransferase family 2 protein [Alloprevotella sp.]|nr:glycosyltransferase family 2 protein [Alloprevotella sp.]
MTEEVQPRHIADGKRPLVSVIVPCYNEEESLPLLYEKLAELMDAEREYRWEVLFIDDGSRDATLPQLRKMCAEDRRLGFVSLSRNFGKERAMLAGFDHVRGDCAVIIDADLQHPPHLIPEMLRHWQEGYDDVYARRTSRGKESWLRRRLSLLYYRLLQRTTRIEVLQNVGDFRLLDRKCIDALRELRETERYTKGMYCWIGFRKYEIRFEQGDRAAGTSSWNFWSLLGLAIEGITSFTTAPLRLSTLFGACTSVAAFLYMCYVLVKTLIMGDPVRGFPTLLITVLFLGGIQLLSIGIIGEYLGRIFYETKKRPVYVVKEHAQSEA